MLTVLTCLVLAWIIVGSALCFLACREFYAPERQPAREAWRREHLDRFHADASRDFIQSWQGFLWVFVVVMVGWPWLLRWTVRRKNPGE